MKAIKSLLLVCVVVLLASCGKKSECVNVNVKDRLTALQALQVKYEKGPSSVKIEISDSLMTALLTDVKAHANGHEQGMCCLSDWQIQLPQCANAKSAFVRDAQDLYNGLEALWCAWSDVEICERAMMTSDSTAEITDSVLYSIKSLNVDCIKDASLRNMLVEMRDSIVWSLANYKGDEDERLPDDYLTMPLGEMLDVRLKSNDESEYMKVIDAMCNDADSLEYCKLTESLDEKGPQEWLQAMIDAPDFRSQCVLALWSARSASTYYDIWTLEAMQVLMDSGQYCDLLPRLLFTWRCLAQMEYCGMSRDSVIPNYVYDRYRKACFTTAVNYALDGHEDDSLRYVITAIIAKPQLIRNGMCLMGSDCMIEMMNMVPGF